MRSQRLGTLSLLAAHASLSMIPAVLHAAPAPCVNVLVSSPQAGNGFGAKFSATQILDLDFSVLFRADLTGDHVVELRALTPSGHLYQSISVPFTADPALRGAKRRVAGYPEPVAVQLLSLVKVPGASFSRVVATLPVAGTPIVSSSLYGRWTVEVYLDGERTPCSAPATFVMAP